MSKRLVRKKKFLESKLSTPTPVPVPQAERVYPFAAMTREQKKLLASQMIAPIRCGGKDYK